MATLSYPIPTVKPQQANLPYTQTGQPLPLTQNAGSGGVPQIAPQQVQAVPAQQQPAAGLNQQLLQTAQQKAIQGFQSPTLQATSQATQQLLAQPQVLTPEQQMQQAQSQLEQADVNRAQTLEAMRQKFAPVIGSGEIRGELLDVALQGQRERGQLQRDIEASQAAASREQLLQALSEGRATSEQERQTFGTNIEALAQIRQAAEGQEQRTFTGAENAIDRGMQIAMANQNAVLQTSLTELKGKIDMGQLLQSQDFEGAQAELGRELEKALAEGNWQNAFQIEQMQQDMENQRLKAQQEWSSAERVATQAYSTTERLGTQDFQKALAYIDQQNALALQKNDFVQQKFLQEQSANLQLKMQTNDMNQAEKMAYLDSQLMEARATNDVERQKQVMSFQTSQNLQLMKEEQGFEAAQAQLGRDLQMALQEGDFMKAETLQRQQLEFQATENAANRQLDQLQIELQKQGMNTDAIMAAVANGTIEPQAAVEQIRSLLPPDVASSIVATDPVEASRKAMQLEYENAVFQFGLTNPQYVDESGNITPDGMLAYNDYFNETVMPGAAANAEAIINGTVDASKIIGNEALYNSTLESAPAWNGKTYFETKGNNQRNFSGGVPSAGSVTNFNGQLYLVTSGVNTNYKTGGGEEYQYITAKDLKTNQDVTIKATGSGAQVV